MAKNAEQPKDEGVDKLKDRIAAIQSGVAELRKTGIRESVLCLLLARASQKYLKNRYSNPISTGDVRAILSGIETFREYVFGRDGNNKQ